MERQRSQFLDDLNMSIMITNIDDVEVDEENEMTNLDTRRAPEAPAPEN